jgi:hypothetical protein
MMPKQMPQYDLLFVEDEQVSVEVQERTANRHVLYVNVDGVTVLRLLTSNPVKIVDEYSGNSND